MFSEIIEVLMDVVAIVTGQPHGRMPLPSRRY